MKVHFEKRKRGTRFSWWCAWKMRCSCMIFHASSNSPRSRDRISIFVFYVHAYNDEAKLGEHTNEHSIADWPFTFVTMYASARSFHGFSMKLESSFSATRERSQKNIVNENKIGLVNLKFKFLLCLYHERICFIYFFCVVSIEGKTSARYSSSSDPVTVFPCLSFMFMHTTTRRNWVSIRMNIR